MAQHSQQSMPLRAYNKDVPPGWRPRAYPIRDYREYLTVWSKLTRLDTDQLGAAIMSRLEGGAWRAANALTVSRVDPADGQLKEYRGVDAVSLLHQAAILDGNGNELLAEGQAGARLLVDRLLELYYLDDQDLAWTSLDKFFAFTRPSTMDFAT